MSSKWEFYRRAYKNANELVPISISDRNKLETAAKMERNLDTIYHSSNLLKNLTFKDTCSLYDILARNGVELVNPLEKPNQENGGDIDMDDETTGENKETEEENTSIADPKGEIHRFIALHDMGQRNKELVMSISNISSSIVEFSALVENTLDFAIKSLFDSIPSCIKKDTEETIAISPGFQWTYMGVNSGSTDSENVYVVFEDAMMLYLFLKAFDGLKISDSENDRMKVYCDIGFEKDIIPKITSIFSYDTDKLIEIRNMVKNHITEIEKIGIRAKQRNKPVDDYLTRCKRLSETYTVNPKDLFDVPGNMVDVVKQNIIDFRLHVLKDLEKKQKERALQDQIEARKQMNLTHISPNNESVLKKENENKYKYMENHAVKNMSDIEFETLLQSKEKSLVEKRYYNRLGQYKRREEIRLKNYNNFVNMTKHDSYTNKVIPLNRKKFLANFVTNITAESNKIDSNFSYYIKHANYAKYRENVKAKEEMLDKEDEAEEQKERETEMTEQETVVDSCDKEQHNEEGKGDEKMA